MTTDPTAYVTPGHPTRLGTAGYDCLCGECRAGRDTDSTTAAQPATPGEALDLDAIEARANAATPGPWAVANDTRIVRGLQVTGRGSYTCIQSVAEVDDDDRCDWGSDEAVVVEPEVDAEFMAAARQDVPALAAEVRRLRQIAAVNHGLYKSAELDAAPAADPGPDVYRLPPEPPVSVTELWDADGDLWTRSGEWWCLGVTEPNTGSPQFRWLALVYKYGPLSTTPPASEPTAQFWTCPTLGHSDRRGPDGQPVVTVEWLDDVAHCTADGCEHNSAEGTPPAGDSLYEKLAAIEHDRWSSWQHYLHSQCTRSDDGSLTIPAHLVTRWERQINTLYDELTEREKDSDRQQVEKYWHLIKERKGATMADDKGKQPKHKPLPKPKVGPKEGDKRPLDDSGGKGKKNG